MLGGLKRLATPLYRRCLSLRYRYAIRKPRIIHARMAAMFDQMYAVMEQVAAGRDLDEHYWGAMLRKHAHIMDKGMQRQDSQPGHSLVHQAAVRNMLQRLEGSALLDDPSIRWARDKLAEHEALQNGTKRAVDAPIEVHPEAYQHLRRVMLDRRSVRSYEVRPVPDALMEQVSEVLNWSATSCNRQPGRVFCTNDPALAHECLCCCAGFTCFSDYCPALMVFCADLRPYFLPQEVWLPMLDIGLGTQNCALTAHTLGLSMTLLSWAQHTPTDDRNLRRLLAIPEYYVIVVVAAIGYPNRAAPVPERKSTRYTCTLRKRASHTSSESESPP